jgi:hypothetical protein
MAFMSMRCAMILAYGISIHRHLKWDIVGWECDLVGLINVVIMYLFLCSLYFLDVSLPKEMSA